MPDHIKSLSDSSVHGAVVLNPDGSNIGSSPSLPTDAATETEQQAQTTLLTTIEANQLPDGHNVTIDNASIPVTGTFWQTTQPVSGTVTANLSATDNAVLDQIEANQILLPTEGNNQSAVYGYTAGKLTSITLTIGATSYVKTFSYTGEDLTGETAWSVV